MAFTQKVLKSTTVCENAERRGTFRANAPNGPVNETDLLLTAGSAPAVGGTALGFLHLDGQQKVTRKAAGNLSF